MANSNSGCVLASLEYVINGLHLLHNEQDISENGDPKIRHYEERLGVEKYSLERTLSTIYGTVLPAGRGDWESAAVDDNLRTRLGSFLGKFYAIQDRLNIILTRLGRLAQLDRDDAPWKQTSHQGGAVPEWVVVPGNLLATITPEAIRQLMYAISSGEIQQFIEKINSENDRMMRVFRQSLRIGMREGLEVHRERFRARLQTTSQLLGNQSGFECACSPNHCTLVKVDDTIRSSDRPAYDHPIPLSFHSSPPAGWHWWDIIARLSRYTEKPTAKKRKKSREDTDLCEFLYGIANNPSVPLPSFDLIRDGWELKLSPKPADTDQDPDTSLVRFSEVLETHPSAMSTEQKLKLALDVAWTVLYLSHTPWLRSRWTSDDIYVRQKSGHTMPNAFAAHTKGGTMMETAADSEPSIFALGIFLTELSFGAPWPYICRLFADNPPNNELFNPQWIEEAWGGIDAVINNNNIAPWDRPFYREGLSYYEAARNCIRGGNFDRYFTHVIQPLEFAVEDYNQHQIYGPILDDFSELGLGTNEASDDAVFARLFDDRDVRAGTQELAEKWFDQYSSDVVPMFRDRPTGYGNRVRVAILDTGVDPIAIGIREALNNGQLHYRNFANGHDSAQDTHGHGTAVTSLLLRVAPNVDVYVARVTPDGDNWDYTKFCKAINWATVEKRVHIISLSLGFSRLLNRVAPIRKAIWDAYVADVLIFAAAHNDGNLHPVGFPAGMDEVICVGSTDGHGNRSVFTTDTLPVDRSVCLVGEGLLCSWPRSNMGQVKSGNSYAAPIAAGLAAVLLDLMWPRTDDEASVFNKLRTKRGMLRAMDMLRRRKGDIYCMLTPWVMLKQRTRDHLRSSITIGLDEI